MRRIVSEGLFTRMEGVFSNRLFVGDVEESEVHEQDAHNVYRLNSNEYNSEEVLAEKPRTDLTAGERFGGRAENRDMARKRFDKENSARVHCAP